MPLFMDTHKKGHGLTVEEVVKAHQRDLEVQAKYGVRYVKGWFDETSGKVFLPGRGPRRGAGSGAPLSSRPAGRRDHTGAGVLVIYSSSTTRERTGHKEG
ncbi:hypothetical protein BH20ACT22_BH20ACT22_20330 [soil metagenome]